MRVWGLVAGRVVDATRNAWRNAWRNGPGGDDLEFEIENLRAIILAIARIVENPDDRALQQVRDLTDKHLRGG